MFQNLRHRFLPLYKKAAQSRIVWTLNRFAVLVFALYFARLLGVGLLLFEGVGCDERRYRNDDYAACCAEKYADYFGGKGLGVYHLPERIIAGVKPYQQRHKVAEEREHQRICRGAEDILADIHSRTEKLFAG